MTRVISWRKGIRRISLVLAVLIGAFVLVVSAADTLDQYKSNQNAKVLHTWKYWENPNVVLQPPRNESPSVELERFFNSTLPGSLAGDALIAVVVFFAVWLMPYWIILAFASFGAWIAEGFKGH